MKRLCDFKPPEPNQAFISLCELLVPVYLKLVDHLTFKFLDSQGSKEFLKGKQVVIVVNHPDKQDPVVVVALAKFMHVALFYSVAAREVFDWNHGLIGWLLQRFGCYSVKRGTIDLKSIHTTQRIVSHSEHNLVVFPEAEVTGDDLLVHDFSSSFIHVILAAQDEIVKEESGKSVWVLPVAVSYKLETDLHTSVNKTLNTVERKLNIHPDHTDVTARTRVAIGAVLQNLSEYYGFTLPDDQTQHEQVGALVAHILERIGTYRAVAPGKKLSMELLLHRLQNDLRKEIDTSRNRSRFQQNLWQNASKISVQFLSDLDRVERLMILQRVLSLQSSPIQICRTVDFLERETCGRMTSKGRQCASVCFGKPVEVLAYLQLYKSSKNSAVDQLAKCIKSELQLALDSSHGSTIECERSLIRKSDEHTDFSD